MPGSMVALNYATEYQRLLDQQFPYVLYFGALRAASFTGYRWINAKTIEVPHMKTTGREDGNRDVINPTHRNYTNEWDSYTLTQHRMWDTLVHPADIMQTNMVATIGNITYVFNTEQKFPEMDAYLSSRLYDERVRLGGATYNIDKVKLTTENILNQFDKMMLALTEKRVPVPGRQLYVTPDVKTILKNAKDIQRNFDVQATNAQINRIVSSLDQVLIQEVPQELMMTAYDFSNGWEVGATAEKIKMIMVHPISVMTPVYYEFARLDEPSAGSQGKFVYYEESMEDVFVLKHKHDALYFTMDA